MTTPQDVAVTYTGTDDPFKDRIYRSGLTFAPGQTRLVPATLAQRFLRHSDVFKEGAAGEVKKAEVDRFLQFIGIRPGKDDPGDMRLDNLKSFDFMGIEVRVLQGGNQVLAHG